MLRSNKFNTTLQKVELFFNRHGRISVFLSHGALHIALALFLIIAIIVFIFLTARINESKLRKIEVNISEYSDDISGKAVATMSSLKVHAYLNGSELDNYTEPFIAVAPNTLNLYKSRIKTVLHDKESYKPINTNETDDIIFNTFTEVKITVPELKESLSADSTIHIRNIDYNGKVNVYAMDVRTVSNNNTVQFKTYYTDITNNFTNLRENEYIVKAGKLYKETSTRNPFINLYLKIDGKLISDDSDTLIANPKSEIQFVFSRSLKYGKEVNSPYAIASIHPTPNQISPDIIGYIGNESVREVLDNGGVYMQLYDIKAKAKAEKSLLWGSVLIGLLFGILLDIIVELLHKWKKLTQK